MSDDFAGKRVVVMGLGRFGGGVGAVKWLARQGAKLLVTDLSPAEKLAESIAEIQDEIDSGVVELRLGAHEEADFRAADVVVVSPAVPKPWGNRYLLAAQERGAKLTTEIRLLVEYLPNRDRTIGVTGTAGKSTTTAMIAHILRELGSLRSDGRNARPTIDTDAADGRDARPTVQVDYSRVWFGGNIGGSLLPRVGEIDANDWVVLELSSAQLYWLSDWFIGRRDEAGWSPHVAVVTNVMPNHLDWHGSFEHYERCKNEISRHQVRGDKIIRGDDVEVKAEQRNSPRLVGEHNRRNAILAGCAVFEATSDESVWAWIDDALRTFTGLPHRLQLVAEAKREGGAIRAYNDSKCTTPEAAALAVQAFADGERIGAGRVHLIAGGYDKGVDLAALAQAGARCKGVYTIGNTGPGIALAVTKQGGHAVECEVLDRAVESAVGAAAPGDVILLSLGCASWDQFENYEERGECFTELVRAGLGLAPAPPNLFEMPAEV